MLQAIVYDIRHFIVVVAVIGLMFGHVLYLRLGELDADSFGFHDDGTPNPFATLDRVFMSLYLLGFVGDFDADTFQAPVDKVRLTPRAVLCHAIAPRLPSPSPSSLLAKLFRRRVHEHTLTPCPNPSFALPPHSSSSPCSS